jgi:hypothetical protein
MIADEPLAFGHVMCELYENELLWNTLSAKGMELVERNFSAARARDALTALFEELNVPPNSNL